MSTCSRGIVPLVWILYIQGSKCHENSNHKEVRHSFEEDFSGWVVENSTWERISLKKLSKSNDRDIPSPKELNDSITNDYVLIPSANLSDSSFGIMRKDFVIKEDSDLEVFFSALALGWKDEAFLLSPMNPLLEVLYNDVKVFQLDSAIRDNRKYFSPNKWNQFRLFSSYKLGSNMTISILGKRGLSSNILAIDNVIVKQTIRSSVNTSEPEMDVKENDGAWERLASSLEEEMLKASSNHSIKSKPEFCDLNYEAGPCGEKWPRYYYNRTTKTCESFIFGGCNGNSNNFNLKSACESVCKLPSMTDDTMLLKEQEKTFSLQLDFEKDLLSINKDDGWIIKHFSRVNYDNYTLNISRNSGNSKYGISPNYNPNTIFRRPTLLHPVNLIPDVYLNINFSLLLIGDVDMHIHPFFEHLNPGFKIYIGDFLVFDFLSAGITEKKWHNYTIWEKTNNILDSPDLTNFGNEEQILRIESWKGSALDESEIVILDDFSLIQVNYSGTPSPDTESTTVAIESTSTPTSVTEVTTAMLETTFVVSDADDQFPCNLPMDSGPCKANLSRYYFDSVSGECLHFSYGGCKGNANRFKNMENCLTICSQSVKNGSVDTCQLSVDLGDIKCSSYSERYFYDAQVGNCLIFLYSGCGGNLNNFQSNQECERQCMNEEDSRSIAKKTFLKVAGSVKQGRALRRQDCLKGTEVGPCSGNYIAYAYDADKNECIRFVYGGCGGNKNRFYSIEKCRSFCRRPKVKHEGIGIKEHCHDAPSVLKNTSCSTRYFFDSKSSSCIAGCAVHKMKGFSSSATCMKNCAQNQLHTTVASTKASFGLEAMCTMPLNTGSPICNDSLPRYYFDSPSKTCKSFIYTGCGVHDGNMFPTKEICTEICLSTNHACYMPLDAGSTHCGGAKSIRFYYNVWEAVCQSFNYSGCGGNANNFDTLLSCRKTCNTVNSKVLSVASSPPVQNSFSSINAPTIAEIVLGLTVLILFVAGICLAFKYYNIQRNYGTPVSHDFRSSRPNFSYIANCCSRLFRNDSTRSLCSGTVGMAYDNPSYNAANENTFQLKSPSHTSSSEA